MTRNNADLTIYAIAEKIMTAHFTMQIVFALCTSRRLFAGNENVETDILNCVDTMMNVSEEVLVGIYIKVMHVNHVKHFQLHHISANSVPKVSANNAQSMTKLLMKRQIAI